MHFHSEISGYSANIRWSNSIFLKKFYLSCYWNQQFRHRKHSSQVMEITEFAVILIKENNDLKQEIGGIFVLAFLLELCWFMDIWEKHLANRYWHKAVRSLCYNIVYNECHLKHFNEIVWLLFWFDVILRTRKNTSLHFWSGTDYDCNRNVGSRKWIYTL